MGMAQVPRSSYWNRVKIEFSPKYLPPQKKTEEDSHTTHTGKMLKKSAFHPKRACICPPPPPPHLGVFWGFEFWQCWDVGCELCGIYLKTLPGWTPTPFEAAFEAISYQLSTRNHRGTKEPPTGSHLN